jgi:pimeloyl-ACP methyl ester carboxylesterase
LIAASPGRNNPPEPPVPRWPGGAVEHVVVLGGVLVVETQGAGPPLLLLHGWTLDRRMWLPQLPLAHHFTLVGVDRRGFGQSTALPNLAGEPDDVLRIADVLGLDRFHLVGMSQSGRVALAVADRAADRLLSLTLQGAALDGVSGEDEQMPIAAMTAAARSGDLPGMRSLVEDHHLMQPVNPAGDMLAAAMLADYDGRDLLAQGQVLPAFAEAIAGATFPVTAIVGSEDTPRRRANANALAAAGATLIVLPQAGHLCNIDSPDAFNAAILSRHAALPRLSA